MTKRRQQAGSGWPGMTMETATTLVRVLVKEESIAAPATPPASSDKKSDELNDGKFEGIESKDLSDSLPGNILETTDTEHEVDQSRIGPQRRWQPPSSPARAATASGKNHSSPKNNAL